MASVVSEVPKPMALVGGKPFLAYLIEQLRQTGLTKVVLSVGHFAGEMVGPPQCRAW